MNALTVHFLKAMLQHRPVELFEYVVPDFHDVVGCDTENVRIVGAMVNSTQRQSVWNFSDSAFVPVLIDEEVLVRGNLIVVWSRLTWPRCNCVIRSYRILTQFCQEPDTTRRDSEL